MKVTMVNAEWLPVPPVLGGPVEETLFETAISIRDPELTVISPWAEALSGSEAGPEGIFYHVDIDAQAARVRDVLGEELPSGLRHPKAAKCFYYLNGATDLLLDIGPDIIQVHNRPEFVPYLLKQFPNRRLVLYMHNEANYSSRRLSEVIPDVDRFVFVSRYLARRFISRYPKCESKITVIHNSVDTDVWHPKLKGDPETEKIRREYGLSPGRTALFVGRTVFAKGIHCLLEAMDIVRRRLPDVKLLVVGSPFFGAVSSGPFLRDLKGRASQMGETVVFTGYVDHPRTPYFYAAADVTVVPSIWGEPFGKVVVESMAAGVPVIGSRRGGIPEIVGDGADGFLIDDPKDVKTLARLIVELLENPERRREMGAAARRKAVGRFTTSIRLKRVRAFYRALEEEKSGPGVRSAAGYQKPGVHARKARPGQEKARMKVTMVNAEKLPVPPALGGPIEETLFETAISVRDPELTVISPWAEALNGSEIDPSGVFYHVDIDTQAAKVRGLLGEGLPSWLGEPEAARRFYYLNGVTDLLIDIDPDVIQVHNCPELVPYLLKQFPEKQMVLYMHGEPRLQCYRAVRMDLLVQEIDHLVFVSHYLARRFISRYPGYESKVTVIYNSIDTEVWHPRLKEGEEAERIRRDYGLRRGRTALFVGRTVPRKGLHCLLKAMDIVRRRLPDVKLLVVGSPFFEAVATDPFLEGLKRDAFRLGDAVSFTGYVEHNKLPHFFGVADVTVVPSILSEGHPKVVLESMAAGVPVIGSRRGGILEMIDDDVNGLIVDNPEDVESLASCVVELLKDSERRREMGAAARRKAVQHFTTSIRLERLRAFYRSLAEGGETRQAHRMSGVIN